MWQHFLYQISDVSHLKLDCFIRSVWSYEPAAPSLLNYVEQFSSICILADRKARSHLPTEAMTLARLKRNAEATFPIYESRDIRCCVHKQRSEPACYGINLIPSKGSQPLSRYGDSRCRESYPRYYPRCACTEHREGFTDLSWLNETVSLLFRAVQLCSTRQGISLP